MSCGRSSAIISPGSTGRSCWSTLLRALNSGPAALRDLETRARPTSCMPSAPGAPRGSARSSGRASTASCSPPPRPTICITPTTTGSRRCCKLMTGRAIARAEGFGAADRRRRARRGPRDARSRNPPRRRDPAGDRRHAGSGRAHRRSGLRRRRRGGGLPRPIARRSGGGAGGRGAGAAGSGQRLALRPLPAAERPARGAPPPHIRLDRALQFLIGDRLA